MIMKAEYGGKVHTNMPLNLDGFWEMPKWMRNTGWLMKSIAEAACERLIKGYQLLCEKTRSPYPRVTMVEQSELAQALVLVLKSLLTQGEREEILRHLH
jgi:hypothetical protein